MDKLAQLELRLRCRNIVRVLCWWDDEQTVPWEYIERSGDGGFTAVTTVVEWRPDYDEMVPISLGTFADIRSAMAALREYASQMGTLRRLRGDYDD
jgi:hypothetical protein